MQTVKLIIHCTPASCHFLPPFIHWPPACRTAGNSTL